MAYSCVEEILELARQLKKYKKIAVVSHVRPDGDAIGSQTGLCCWLRANQIEFLAHNDDAIPNELNWINTNADVGIRRREKEELETCDAFIFADGNAPKRFGYLHEYFESSAKPAYCIDHHPDPEDGYSFLVSVPEAASTAELVYLLFRETMPNHSEPHAYRALYAGIVTDTGSFRFSSVTPELHHYAAELIEKGGFNVSDIHQKLYDSRSINQLNLLSRVLSHIEIHDSGKMASMYVTDEDLKATGCSYEDTDGFTMYPLSVAGVDVAIIFIEREEKIKMSMRSKSDFDVNKLARKYSGGGHQKASGAWFSGSMDQAITEVMRSAIEMR
ncbi:MAG: bifunctional oligoribonuclease/PAP phosphatase NrnA [Balneolales bacterium]|nr:bifunctional oligoribonuclease/PAP phosphatase NrnA [Balneolales bacterium]